MPKLTDIQKPQETKDLELDFGDGVIVNMTVLPDKFTLGRQRKMNKAMKDKDLPSLSDAMFEVITAWDVTDEKDRPIPLNAKGVDELRWETVVAISIKMAEALQVPKAQTSSV